MIEQQMVFNNQLIQMVFSLVSSLFPNNPLKSPMNTEPDKFVSCSKNDDHNSSITQKVFDKNQFFGASNSVFTHKSNDLAPKKQKIDEEKEMVSVSLGGTAVSSDIVHTYTKYQCSVAVKGVHQSFVSSMRQDDDDIFANEASLKFCSLVPSFTTAMAFGRQSYSAKVDIDNRKEVDDVTRSLSLRLPLSSQTEVLCSVFYRDSGLFSGDKCATWRTNVVVFPFSTQADVDQVDLSVVAALKTENFCCVYALLVFKNPSGEDRDGSGDSQAVVESFQSMRFVYPCVIHQLKFPRDAQHGELGQQIHDSYTCFFVCNTPQRRENVGFSVSAALLDGFLNWYRADVALLVPLEPNLFSTKTSLVGLQRDDSGTFLCSHGSIFFKWPNYFFNLGSFIGLESISTKHLGSSSTYCWYHFLNFLSGPFFSSIYSPCSGSFSINLNSGLLNALHSGPMLFKSPFGFNLFSKSKLSSFGNKLNIPLNSSFKSQWPLSFSVAVNLKFFQNSLAPLVVFSFSATFFVQGSRHVLLRHASRFIPFLNSGHALSKKSLKPLFKFRKKSSFIRRIISNKNQCTRSCHYNIKMCRNALHQVYLLFKIGHISFDEGRNFAKPLFAHLNFLGAPPLEDD